MSIVDFIDNQVESFPPVLAGWLEIARYYMDGLIRGHKKSAGGMMRELHLDVSRKKLLEATKHARDLHPVLKRQVFLQLHPFLDRRSKVIISGDDTTHRVYGKAVYGAAYQHDHALNAFIKCRKIVDLVAVDSKRRVLFNDFDVYLPREFIEKSHIGPHRFRKKGEILLSLLVEDVRALKLAGVPAKSIWVITDCWYVSGRFEKRIRESGANSLLQLKKNWHVRLFDEWVRIDDFSGSHGKWHYSSYGEENKRVYYMEAIMDVRKMGRRKIFAFREENEKSCRYFVTGDLKLTAKTAYRHVKRRWSIETMHREEKQFFGLCGTHSASKDFLEGHGVLVSLTWLLFQWYKWRVQGEDERLSTEELWMQYIMEMNEKEKINERLACEKRKITPVKRSRRKNYKSIEVPLEIKVS